jgi:hypothetical protein
MLVTNPAHRATVSEIMIHPWMNKGFDAPIDNYLTDRKPLTIPLDNDVIRAMTEGFEFGSQDEIKEKLEAIVSSEGYQKASKLLSERSRRRHSFTLPNDDPQSIPAAYQPLVSIYYLVKERMQRQQNKSDKMDKQPEMDVSRRSSDASSIKIPDMAVLHKDKSPTEDTRERRPSASSTTRRVSMYSSSDDDNDTNDTELRRLSLSLHPPPMENDKASLSAPMKYNQSYTSQQQLQQLQLTDEKDTKNSRLIPRRMTVGQTCIPDSQFLKMIHNTEGRLASCKAPVQQLPNVVVEEKANIEPKSHHYSFHQPNGFQQVASTTKKKNTADQNIKPVFLKGLFSVTTTSTKHPSIIRADLIQVLERIGVKWREGRGYFECVHMPSIDVTNTDMSLPDIVMRFEIYIVKVPWLLGMHGLQFRMMGGNPLQYKNMCRKILSELKL